MPDAITPVGAMIKPPDPSQGLNTLSGIIGIQQQKQKLAQEVAGTQQAQQQMRERMFLQGMMKTGKDDQGNSILGADGSPDPQKIIPAISRNMPLTGQPVIQSIVKTQSDKANLDNAVRELGQNYRNDLSGIARSFVNNPKAGADDVKAAFDQYVSANPRAAGAGHWASNLVDAHYDNMGPDQKNDALIHLAQQFQPSTETAQQQQPSIGLRQGPTGQQPVQTNTLAPGGVRDVGAPLPQGIAPQIVTFPNQQLGTAGAGQGGLGSGGRSAVASGPPAPPGTPPNAGAIRTAAQDAPPPNAPKVVQDQYYQAVQDSNKHVADVRTADQDYGNNVRISNTIRDLSRGGVDTGPGSETWHHVMGAIGAPLGASNVAGYQKIDAYLERQAAISRTQMGLPPTNEGVATAKAIQGNTGFQPEALQDKNDYTQALVEGVHQYRKGLDRVAGFGGNASPVAIQEFRAKWADNFDPNVYRLENAQARGKKGKDGLSDDARAFIATLPPEERVSLNQKRLNLMALSRGQIPQ